MGANATSIVGAGGIGTPGAAWSVQGAAPAARQELPGMVFFQNASGTIAAWNVQGGVNAGGPTFGSAGGTYTMLGVGDFNGDLQPDILFQDAGGAYATWQTNGATITGGGPIGNPGGGFAFRGTGDFNGDGVSDLLFQDASGN